MSIPIPFENLIKLLKRLPGIGEKSARRMAFYIFQSPEDYSLKLSQALKALKHDLKICENCGNITDIQPCNICRDLTRDRSTICVVENVEDLISIEQSGVYDGLYHVLGGTVSPLEGRDLPSGALSKLKKKILDSPVKEVIIATNPRVEGDMTYHAVVEALKGVEVKKSRLAYGLPVGGSIEFADRVTLHAALDTRVTVDDDRN